MLAKPLTGGVWLLLALASTAVEAFDNAALTWTAQRLLGGTPLDFTPAATQPGLQATLEANENCAGCHGQPGDEVDRRVFPFSSWAGTMMANANRDPLFYAALDVANSDVPGVGDYCLRCHAPSAWLRGRVVKDGAGGTIDGANACGLQGQHDFQDFAGSDYDGVGCHYCHRVMPTSLSGAVVRNENANAWVDDSLTCEINGLPGPCRRGPYQYPDPIAPTPPHAWVYSSDLQRSEFCATCHNVTTPILPSGPLRTLILNDGVDTGIPFPVERTFTEWKQSAYADRLFADGFSAREPATEQERFGQTCQNCHMPVSSEPAARACTLADAGSRSGNLPVHELVGANVWMPQLIKLLYGGELQLDRALEFDRTIALATEMLTERSAELAVALDPIGSGAQTLAARVRVTNLAGHKLPTGYAEGRRMWVHVEARDANNALVFESAAYDAATGTLTRDAQARVYEVQHGIWSQSLGECVITDAMGREQFHFVLGDCIRKDNRIPPLGFRGGDDLETRPVGQTYPESAPGSGRLVNYDDITYAIPIAAAAARPITVTATLRHQIASREYIEFLRDEAARVNVPSESAMCQASTGRPPLATGPRDQRRGDFMYDLWINNGRSPPVTMKAAIATTPL